jgi:hypothetical protein
MLAFLTNELLDIAARPALWLGTLGACVFLIFAASNLNLDDKEVRVIVYDSANEKDAGSVATVTREMETLANELSGIKVLPAKILSIDLASGMSRDDVHIALTLAKDERSEGTRRMTWRLTIRADSRGQHRRLVRYAQLLGATITRRKPWFVVVYQKVFERESPIEQVCYRASQLCALAPPPE